MKLSVFFLATILAIGQVSICQALSRRLAGSKSSKSPDGPEEECGPEPEEEKGCDPEFEEQCICRAEAAYDETTDAVTIDFDYCDVPPVRYDFIGVYPCDAPVMEITQEWWDSLCGRQRAACGEIEYGYEEGQVYVNQMPLWWTYTCGSPGISTCQQDPNAEWPSSGTVIIDPNVAGAEWAFGEMGNLRNRRSLAPGCYKVLMNREMDFISPPPYPTICLDWGSALEFQVS